MGHGPLPAPAESGGGGYLRYKGLLAYDGTRFHGWARQPGVPTVEQHVVAALARILRLPEVHVVCAGRTDAGVHAQGQVVHFDAPPLAEEGERLVGRLNAVLPPDIRFYRVEAVPSAFDARFAALWRRYRYHVVDGVADPLTRNSVATVRRRLDVGSMDAAAQVLVGEHDFGSFCKPRAGATTIREVLDCRWRRREDGVIRLDIRADAFCHSMVRAIVGASLQIGMGRATADWLRDLLASPSRLSTAPVAPAAGLVLLEVGYPPVELMADRVAAARRLRTLRPDCGGSPGR